ncbi:MAG: hypothetical protein AAF629_00785 [Chloroflexota bacterium]
MEDSVYYLLRFLLIFHILGTIALANAVKGLWNAAQGESEAVFGHLFFLFFGCLFGCSPLYYGLRFTQTWWFLTIQLSVVIITFLATLFRGDEIWYNFRSLFNLNTALVLLGSLFIITGLYSAVLVFNDPNGILLGLILGGTFNLIGIGIIVLGVTRR